MHKKTILHIFIVLAVSLLLYFLAGILERYEVVEMDGLEFIQVSKEDIVMRAQKGYIFITENEKNRTHVYKILSDHSAYRPSVVVRSVVTADQIDINQLVIGSKLNQLAIGDTLSLSYQDMVNLVSTEKFVVGRWTKPIPRDWFEGVEESSLIFLVIAGFIFLLLSFYYVLVWGIGRLFSSFDRTFMEILIVAVTIGSITYVSVDWYCLSKFPVLVENCLWLIPLYELLKYLKSKLNLPSGDWMVFRFVVLIAGTIVFFNIGNLVGRWIDITFFEGTKMTGIYNRIKVNMMVGFAFSFALADLVLNVILFKMRKTAHDD